MTNPYFGFIGPCNRCGVRMTLALVCKLCELGQRQAEEAEHEIEVSSIVDARLSPEPSPADRERSPARAMLDEVHNIPRPTVVRQLR
jgi:hypothetical protein